MTGERTIQQQYPLGALGGRPMAITAAVIAPLYGVLMAFRNREDIHAPLLTLASVVLIAIASAAVVVASSPLRAPLRSQTAAFVVLCGAAGMIVGAASMWGTDDYIRDDWGPTAVALLILSLTGYRPPRELVLLGAVGCILAGVLALLQTPAFAFTSPPIVFVLVTITPIAVLTTGGAVFAQCLLVGIARWRRTARSAVRALGDDAEWIARSVQQDRVTILNRDVVPFFAELLQTETVTDAHRDRARAIADSIRAVMVAEADRSWLHSVVESALPAGVGGGADPVIDEHRLADRMSIDQRSALRALIAAICAHPDFSARGFRIRIGREGSTVDVELVARIATSDQRMRSELAPYFAVLRILFADLAAEFAQPVLALKFSYDD